MTRLLRSTPITGAQDFAHFSRVLHAGRPSLLVWSGIELLCLPLLALGGVGFISAVANVAPHTVAMMYQAWVDGDHDTARRLHYALRPLVDALFVETNPSPAKWIMRQQGRIASAHVGAPLIDTTDVGINKIQALLHAASEILADEKLTDAASPEDSPANARVRPCRYPGRTGSPCSCHASLGQRASR